MKEISQISFDTKYKFQVSLGTLFIILPFVFISYIFSINKDEILFTNEQYNNFTKESQSIVDKLQNNYELTFCFSLLLLVFCILIGIFLIYNGLSDWTKFEDLDYEEKALKISEINKRITKASPQKIEESIKSDLKLEQLTEETSEKIKYYQSIENSVVRRIYETSPVNYKIVSDSILNRFLYDVIAIGQDMLHKDIIFEIKYLQNNIGSSVLDRYITKLYELSDNYSIETNRKPYKKLIFVTTNEVFCSIDKLINMQKKRNNFSIIVLKENEIKKTNFFN